MSTLAQQIRERGLGQVQCVVFRESQRVAVFEDAVAEHFDSARTWLEVLFGGRQSFRVEAVLTQWYQQPVALGHVDVVLESHHPPHELDTSVLQLSWWRGPRVLSYPQAGDIVELALPRRRAPFLREPLRHLTVGYHESLALNGHPMIDGRAGAFPGDGYFDRMFVVGSVPAPWSMTHQSDFSFGQGATQESRQQMPGISIRVNDARQRYHYSLEVVQACSKGHVDASVLEAVGVVTGKLSTQQTELAEVMGDPLVRLYQALERLKDMPLVGYQLNPVIAFKREHDLRIEGVPVGMRLYLTGVCEAER